MNLDKKQTDKGCIEYSDADMRSVSVPIRIPTGFVMYRVCGNACCMNSAHMYFVDGDTSHQIEMALRDQTLNWLRKYFKVNHQTLEPLEPKLPANDDQSKLWVPQR